MARYSLIVQSKAPDAQDACRLGLGGAALDGLDDLVAEVQGVSTHAFSVLLIQPRWENGYIAPCSEVGPQATIGG